MTGPAEGMSDPATAADQFITLSGPTVPRSHSFLPLRCGPPIYFPLPAPYDAFCLTGVLPTDRSPTNSDGTNNATNDNGDVVMRNGELFSSTGDAQTVVTSLGQVEGSGGWEYPVIRRTSEINALITDPSTSVAVVGTFALQPNLPTANGTTASAPGSTIDWDLRNVWIDPEERGKGLATLVITYVLHSWLFRLPGDIPRVIAHATRSDTATSALFARLGFSPSPASGQNTISEGMSIHEYTWTRLP